MKPIRKMVVAACLASMTFIGAASAQTPPPAQPVAPVDGQVAYRAKNVLGSTVQLQGDARVGTVDDIVFDSNGTIEYVIVLKDDKLVTVPWTAVKFNYEKKIAIIDMPIIQYQKIPTFTVTTYPNFYAPAYRTEIYRHYGLTPGQVRRIERRP